MTETFAGITKTYRYDAVGRLSEVVESSALGDQTTRYQYDALGQKIAQTDAQGRTTRWAYDAGGRVVMRTLPDGSHEDFLWDAIGNLVAYTDFDGASVVHRYDVMDRKTQTRWADGRTFDHVYDDKGRLLRIEETLANGAIVQHLGRSYTTYNELAQELFNGNRKARTWVNYQYDASGARTEVAASGNLSTFRRTKYAFDANGRLSTVTDAANQVTTHHYDAGNRLVRIERPNGITTHYQYDLRDRITRITHQDAQGVVLLDLQALLDARGLRTQLQETDAAGTTTHAYQYDALARLTQVDSTLPDLSTQSETYTFDAVGNRTQLVEVHTGNGPTRTATTAYVYDDNDRLQSAVTSGDRNQSNQYLYSAHGDLLKEIKDQNGVLTTTRFGYDAEHRLISARVIRGVDSGSNANTPDTIAPNETLLQYRYDPDGVLIGEDRITTASTTGTGGTSGITVPGLQSTDYAIDRSGAYAQIIEERDGQSGKLITSHTWGLTHLSETRTQSRNVQCGTTQDRTNCNSTEIDQIANPHTSWLLQDHLGSTRALTDNTGILTDRFDYNAYGQLARHNQTRFDQFESIQQVNQSTQKRLDKRATAQAARGQQETAGLLASATHLEDGTPSPFPRTQALADAKSQIAQTRSTVKSTSALSSSMLEAATAKTRHLFTGEQLSPETGLGYHRARWLAFEVGRFTQMDAWQGSPADPAGLNKYLYANANPVSYADPTGWYTADFGRAVEDEVCNQYKSQMPTGPAVECGDVAYYNFISWFKPDIMDWGAFKFNELSR
ncbi:MAG: RHS repeat-associated core domain-containing protein [Xanthomonadales bacterium]|nr:RHS repeat-associated core domain-containing protein [Xanthomonadales bacterium]